MAWLDDDIFLTSRTSKRLYHSIAAALPIIDFHNHLSAEQIAENAPFRDLHQLWLEHDHYKWRLIRGAGYSEDLCTGNASPREKFQAWVTALADAPANPLFHWSHLELKRGFGIDLPLLPKHAETIWRQTQEQCAAQTLTPRHWLQTFRVHLAATTNDPLDPLHSHRSLATDLTTPRILPTFRPDLFAQTSDPTVWRHHLERLEQAAKTSIHTLDDFQAALANRHAYFHQHGCRSSDHGLDHPIIPPDTFSPSSTFRDLMNGQPLDPLHATSWARWIVEITAAENIQRDWVMQLHLGARRNPRRITAAHPDTGFDLPGPPLSLDALLHLFNTLEARDHLPRAILYNMRPEDAYTLATLAGTFGGPARIQWGPAWWFLDHAQGITDHLRILAATSAIGRFVGMTTDSRSFLSFSRHELFRRLLCEELGSQIERGLLPNDPELHVRLIAAICGQNAQDFFHFPTLS
ncbi:MAG TPA: glucuronate isomerase [Kiritimatiellia bacterium]|nr:glucuronate isomerase [Kiritimatiellia bacterium]